MDRPTNLNNYSSTQINVCSLRFQRRRAFYLQKFIFPLLYFLSTAYTCTEALPRSLKVFAIMKRRCTVVVIKNFEATKSEEGYKQSLSIPTMSYSVKEHLIILETNQVTFNYLITFSTGIFHNNCVHLILITYKIIYSQSIAVCIDI